MHMPSSSSSDIAAVAESVAAGRERIFTEIREVLVGQDAVIAEVPRGAFTRVHRTAIVNIARVREIRPGATGDYDVVLADGTTVPMSRSHRGLLHF